MHLCVSVAIQFLKLLPVRICLEGQGISVTNTFLDVVSLSIFSCFLRCVAVSQIHLVKGLSVFGCALVILPAPFITCVPPLEISPKKKALANSLEDSVLLKKLSKLAINDSKGAER